MSLYICESLEDIHSGLDFDSSFVLSQECNVGTKGCPTAWNNVFDLLY